MRAAERNEQGIGFRRQGNLAAAAEAFADAALDPVQGPVAQANLASCLLDQGRIGEARKVAEAALARAPDCVLALLAYANVLLHEGDVAMALRYYAATDLLMPNDSDVLANWALALHVSRETSDAALAMYDRAITVDPDHAEARLGRAGILLARGRLAEGWADYRYRPSAR